MTTQSTKAATLQTATFGSETSVISIDNLVVGSNTYNISFEEAGSVADIFGSSYFTDAGDILGAINTVLNAEGISSAGGQGGGHNGIFIPSGPLVPVPFVLDPDGGPPFPVHMVPALSSIFIESQSAGLAFWDTVSILDAPHGSIHFANLLGEANCLVLPPGQCNNRVRATLPTTSHDRLNGFGFVFYSSGVWAVPTLVTVAPVPIPPALGLLMGALGLMGLTGWRRKRKVGAAA